MQIITWNFTVQVLPASKVPRYYLQSRAQQWIADNNVELYWQEELGQYYGETVRDGIKYTLWMEEARSLGLKMDLIRDYNLAGVACWKLGFEPAEIWDVIKLP